MDFGSFDNLQEVTIFFIFCVKTYFCTKLKLLCAVLYYVLL